MSRRFQTALPQFPARSRFSVPASPDELNDQRKHQQTMTCPPHSLWAGLSPIPNLLRRLSRPTNSGRGLGPAQDLSNDLPTTRAVRLWKPAVHSARGKDGNRQSGSMSRATISIAFFCLRVPRALRRSPIQSGQLFEFARQLIRQIFLVKSPPPVVRGAVGQIHARLRARS